MVILGGKDAYPFSFSIFFISKLCQLLHNLRAKRMQIIVFLGKGILRIKASRRKELRLANDKKI